MMNTTNATETTDTLYTIYPQCMPLQEKRLMLQKHKPKSYMTRAVLMP